MSISKRLRFEVFKRDNHTCQYCGRSAPEVVLQVDHIEPLSLGGENKPANLVTACRDCNSGKGSSSSDAARVAAPSVDSMRWARALDEAAADHRRYRATEEEAIAAFRYNWPSTTPPDDFEDTVRKFVRMGLDATDVVRIVEKADKRATGGLRHTWLYFCKVCWSEVRTIRERAQAALRIEEEAPPLDEPAPAPTYEPAPPVPTHWMCVECDDRVAVADGLCGPCRRAHYNEDIA